MKEKEEERQMWSCGRGEWREAPSAEREKERAEAR
jgi:hypothetical protein